MPTNCSTERYEELYAPWLASAPKFAARFIRPGDRVLDLCGGTGVVARAAEDIGVRSINLIDVNPRMIPPLGQVMAQRGDGQKLPKYYGAHSFDVIVCRQAIGYLDLDQVAKAAAQVLAPGGRLCFNNFSRPRWFRKKYTYERDTYIEYGWHLGRRVFHIQRKVGSGWDFTAFRWHTHGEVMEAMSKRFSVFVDHAKKTNYYRCVIKDFD